jgi:hypothetical protein
LKLELAWEISVEFCETLCSIIMRKFTSYLYFFKRIL